MNELKNISKYRTPIMGLSILWVIFYHIGLEYKYPNHVIGKIASLGYGGVDFFIFLSGFGLYYSYLKDNRIDHFYSKRLFRIFPEFIMVTIVFCIARGDFSIIEVLIRISTIGFWFPQFSIPFNQWYVSAIIMFYLAFPLYMNYFNKKPKLLVIVGCVLGLVLTLIYSYIYIVLYPHEKSGLILFTARIPLFCIGVYFARLSVSVSYVTKTFCFILVGLSVLFLIILILLISSVDYWLLRNGGLYYYPFIFIVPGGCLVISRVLKVIPQMARLLGFFGNVSFELYLVHEELICYSRVWLQNVEILSLYFTIGIVVVSIVFAYLVFFINKFFLCPYLICKK